MKENSPSVDTIITCQFSQILNVSFPEIFVNLEQILSALDRFFNKPDSFRTSPRYMCKGKGFSAEA